jgi:hypothetical protein
MGTVSLSFLGEKLAISAEMLNAEGAENPQRSPRNLFTYSRPVRQIAGGAEKQDACALQLKIGILQ